MWHAEINYLLVLVTAIMAMFVGEVWYSPLLFGNEWQRFSGMTPDGQGKYKQRKSGKIYAIQFCVTLLMSYILAQLISFLHAISFGDGAKIGFYLWLGIAIPILSSRVLWERKSMIVFLIDSGYYLASLVLMSGTLSLWS